jgi:hypothetical protein
MNMIFIRLFYQPTRRENVATVVCVLKTNGQHGDGRHQDSRKSAAHAQRRRRTRTISPIAIIRTISIVAIVRH